MASAQQGEKGVPILKHHEVFSHFQPFEGEVPEGFNADFLGTKTRPQFVAGLPAVRYCDVAFDEEYFEWIDLLESIVAARGSYTIVELGAGYGRWVVRAAQAIRQSHNKLPYRLIAVEAEPVVFDWLRLNFVDNGIDPADHSLIHAAVSESPGEILFYIGGPRGGPFDRKPNEWYGQFLTHDYDASGESKEDGEYCGFKVLCHKSGWRSIRVPGISLRKILNEIDRVDLVDMDIEGQELPAIRSAIQELDAKAKRLHIGTHSEEIESELRKLLGSHGWRCQRDYSLHSKNDTPWGTISFENGAQSWVNPRL